MTKTKILIILCVVLVIVVGYLYDKNLNLRWEVVNEKSVPDVELTNTLFFHSNGVAYGEVVGFVAFHSMQKQPRGLRQYYMISASDEFLLDRQVFYLTDIVKMNSLAPRFFEPSILLIESVHGSTVTLSDGQENYFYIDMSTKEVRMVDATGDSTKLITNDLDFRKFIRNFLEGREVLLDELR